MPDDPPQGVKFSAKACTASMTPMVESAKKAPRSLKMPRPKISAKHAHAHAGDERGSAPAASCSEFTSQTQM